MLGSLQMVSTQSLASWKPTSPCKLPTSLQAPHSITLDIAVILESWSSSQHKSLAFEQPLSISQARLRGGQVQRVQEQLKLCAQHLRSEYCHRTYWKVKVNVCSPDQWKEGKDWALGNPDRGQPSTFWYPNPLWTMESWWQWGSAPYY